MGQKEVDREMGEADDSLSDDSSFYGDESVKADFEQRLQSFNLAKYWQVQQRDINVLALQGRQAAEEEAKKKLAEERKLGRDDQLSVKRDAVGASPKAKKEWSAFFRPTVVEDPTSMEIDSEEKQPSDRAFNPYEGDEMAKQLEEPMDSFLTRLIPSKTSVSSGPWIWIANPHSTQRPTHPDIAGFKDEGTELLSEYVSRKRKIEERNPGKPLGSITRLLKADRDWLGDAISKTAVKKGITNGKWMLFPYARHVDDMWKTVATATVSGRLGCAAKVATDNGKGEEQRLICIYTDDFTDRKDVQRVLREMLNLGLVKKGSEDRGVFYKCDAYTYLDIMSGNDYKLKASMYSSKDVFKERGMK